MKQGVMMKLIYAFILFLSAVNGAKASSTPSFSCIFTEPFVSLLTSPMGSYFINMADKPQILQLKSSKIVQNAHLLVLQAEQPKETFELKVIKGKGGDGMSDRQFPFIGAFQFKGNNLEGGCIRFSDGTSPRKIVNVKANDKLNLRESPSNSGKIIASYTSFETLWAFPENAINGWVKVEGLHYPQGENGPVKALKGYVLGQYLGNLR
jgi:uncharacterized membrane protein